MDHVARILMPGAKPRNSRRRSSLRAAQRDLLKLRDPARARLLRSFFKCGRGEYGEGDRFLGLTVPQQRRIARAHRDLSLHDLQALLDSPWHEFRLTGLFILVRKYGEAERLAERAAIYRFYLRNLDRINNWDLVDSSCGHIVGAFLHQRDRAPLYRLARSRDVWRRRVAIVSTFYFIMAREWRDTLRLAEILRSDRHDLIHKATGWMLREVGKRASQAALERFLEKRAATMPRTMLRYAIERFPEARRRHFMTL